MRFSGLALVAAVATLGACGGGEKPAADAGQAAPAAAAPAGGALAAMPATGKTHEIKMVGDEKGYRFEPASLTIKAGDAVKFTAVSMMPHNVAFTNVPAESKAQLQANLPLAKQNIDLLGLAGEHAEALRPDGQDADDRQRVVHGFVRGPQGRHV